MRFLIENDATVKPIFLLTNLSHPSAPPLLPPSYTKGIRGVDVLMSEVLPKRPNLKGEINEKNRNKSKGRDYRKTYPAHRSLEISQLEATTRTQFLYLILIMTFR